MSELTLDEAIYNKYIKPTERKRGRYVGLEFELPIVNLDKRAVDFDVVHKLTDAFLSQFGFDEIKKDDSGDIFSVTKSENGDNLSYDCSFNTLELSFGKEENINVLDERFRNYYSFIQDFLGQYSHTLTGMGTNPYHRYNNYVPIKNGRYRMLFHHLSSYTKYGDAIKFHHNPNFGMFCAASQVQLDVEKETAAEVLNTFNRLEPLKAVVFANSLWSETPELLINRDRFWKYSLHGINPHNLDMYDTELNSVEEIIEYIKSESIYCLERDGKYINFPPTPLREYFSSDNIKGEYFENGEYHTIKFEPRIEDLEYLRSFKFQDLTYRGTVEFRSVCEQPVSEIMAVSAFHAGLIENIHELTRLLERDKVIYGHGYTPTELRVMFSRRKLPDFVNRPKLTELLLEVLDLANDGLYKRGFNEKKFLIPLYHRARNLYSPARQILDGLEAGVPIEYYIKEFSSL